MPNHVINEIVFRGVDAGAQEAIIAKCCNSDGKVDFEGLVPTPPQVWLGDVSTKHERLGANALDWSRENWGTKWNAYRHKPIERTDDTLTLRFDTAWSPPYGWLVAVFNTFKISFDHNWLDEGASRGVEGKWNYAGLIGGDLRTEPWTEIECSDEMQRHLLKLLWSVEEFTDDAA